MRTMTLILLAGLLVLPPEPALGQGVQSPQNPKSEATAWALAVGTTALPFLVPMSSSSESLAGVGSLVFLVGPAAGLIYAKAYKRALLGIGIRVAVVGVTAVAFAGAFNDDNDSAAAVALVGLGGLAFSYIADFGAINPAVREYNQGLRVSPVVGGDGRVGVHVTLPWPRR